MDMLFDAMSPILLDNCCLNHAPMDSKITTELTPIIIHNELSQDLSLFEMIVLRASTIYARIFIDEIRNDI